LVSICSHSSSGQKYQKSKSIESKIDGLRWLKIDFVKRCYELTSNLNLGITFVIYFWFVVVFV